MPRKTTPLSDTEIRQAKPRNSEYTLWDGDGLGLRVKPNGSKLWIFNYYRPFTKKRTNIGLGIYAKSREGIALGEARKIRDKYRDLVGRNIDPKEYRSEQESRGRAVHENTLEVVYRKWIKTKDSAWSKSYRKRLTQALELHILPAMGNMPISKISAPDAIRIITPIADRQALETVRKLCHWINEIMVFAINSGLIDINKLSGIAKVFTLPQVVNQPSIKPVQLPQFLDDLKQANNEITTKCLILWLLHTMARPGEGAEAKWDEIDIEAGLWVIPKERMKKRRTHTVLLTAQSIQILETMKPISQHRVFIFPSRTNPRKSINRETANTAIKRMGYKRVFVAHGVRALASTVLNEAGYPADMIEMSQSRVKDALRAVYNRAVYLKQRREMMQWWSDHIEQAATGNLSLSAGGKNSRAIG